MKDLLIIICSDILGGHEFQAINLAESLSKYYKVTIYSNLRNFDKYYKNKNIKHIFIANSLKAKGKIFIQFFYGIFLFRSNLIKKIYKFDRIIFSAGTIEAAFALLLALRLSFFERKQIGVYLPTYSDRKVIWPIFIGVIYNLIQSFIIKKFDYLITISSYNKKLIAKFAEIPILIHSNKVNPLPLKDDLKNEDLRISNFRIIFIGRLHPLKRIDEIIKWCDFKLLANKELLIIGEGPDENKLKKIALNCKFIKVKFLGWLDSKEQSIYIKKSDILILNSQMEGEPLVLKEGLKRGMRCISRDIPAVREILPINYLFKDRDDLYKIIENISNLTLSSYFKNIKETKKDNDKESSLIFDFLEKSRIH